MDAYRAYLDQAGPNLTGLVRTGIALVALLLATSVTAAELGAVQSNAEDPPTPVSPPEQPTEVAIAVYLIKLNHVSDSSDPFPTVKVELFMDLSWKDPRLASEGDEPVTFLGEEAAEQLSEIWSPDPQVQNKVQPRETRSRELIVHPDGTVDYHERFGVVASVDLDLLAFPFDRQILDLEIQSFACDLGSCVFALNEGQSGFDREVDNPEWTVNAVEARVGVRSEIRDERGFSTVLFQIEVDRSPWHYVLRFMLPLFFVMGLSWVAFWMPLDHRFRVGFIALLTVVASHSTIAKELPPLQYPTFADILLFFCYVFASLLIIVSVVIQQAHDRGASERALTIERRARWLLPTLALLGVLGTSIWI